MSAAECPSWCEWTSRHGNDQHHHYSAITEIELSLEPEEEMLGDHVPEPPVPVRERVSREAEEQWENYLERDRLAVYLDADGQGEPAVMLDRFTYGESLVKLSLAEARQLAAIIVALDELAGDR